jgi:ubiquitin-activating enzyme E1
MISPIDITTQPVHLGFIIATANLHAFNYGLRGETDETVFRKIADAVIVPEFTPKSGVKIQVNENEPVAESGAGEYYPCHRQHVT